MRRLLILVTVCSCFVGPAWAQKASTSSPYSKFGLGELRGSQLPQTRAMGGIETGVRYVGRYSNINTGNPASYAALQLTTIDAGVLGNIAELSNRNLSERSYNFALSHINFAFPLARAGGISFGLAPYSDVGYNYLVQESIDTTAINKVYAGEGGTSTAYLGYGFRINRNISVGANVNYVFGTVTHVRSVEYPAQVGALNGREDADNRISGFTYGYGVQYFQPLKKDMHLVFGYAGTLGTDLRSQTDILSIRTPSSVSDGTDNLPVDTITYLQGQRENIRMPIQHRAGMTWTNGDKWMIGADVRYGRWSDFEQGGVNAELKDAYGVSLGGQFVPDPTSVRYLSVVDYRWGLTYDKTYIHIGNEEVDRMAFTLGLGLPLRAMFGSSFYKINIAAEIGQMGKISNQLVRERFVNISLGFTLNDRWFRRASYD